MTRPRTVRRLVADGDYAEALKAMAVRLAGKVDDPDTNAAQMAAACRELRPALLRLAELSPGSSEDEVDELSRRRRNRAAG